MVIFKLQGPDTDIINLQGSGVATLGHIPRGQPLVPSVPELHGRSWRIVGPGFASRVCGVVWELLQPSNGQIDDTIKL